MAGVVSYRQSHKDKGRGQVYDRYYATDPWARFLWWREQGVLQDILETYFAGREVHLLDFACGTGRITGFLEGRVATSVGVDVSESMLEAARVNLKRTELIRADITRDKVLRGRKFNLITAFRFFANAEPALRRAALKALVPLLTEDGCLVFNNHRNRSAPMMMLGFLLRDIRSHTNLRVLSVAEMRNLASAVGLEVISIYPIGFCHLPKVRLPVGVHRALDGVAGSVGCLVHLCESPIAVCRRRRWLQGAGGSEKGMADGIRGRRGT